VRNAAGEGSAVDAFGGPTIGASIVEGVEVSWDRIPELFSLDPAVGHLNHGSYGAVPIPVQRAQRRLREEMEANPMAFFTRGLLDRLAHTRRHLAAFLGADPDGAALVPNATAAVQVVLGSLRLRAGDEILLTDHGYGAVRMAVERLCRRTGAILREVSVPLDADDRETVALVASASHGCPRLVIIDHVASATAKLFPVTRIVAALREFGVPVLVDGGHAPGMLPVDVAATGADFWLGNLHKWAFAPRSTAVLVVAPEHRDAVEPLVISWQQESGFPGAVEYAGTLDYTAWLAAPAAVHTLRALGFDAVRRHNADLAAYGQATLGTALGVDRADLPGPTVDIEPAGADHPGAAAPVSMRLVPLPPGVADDRPAAAEFQREIATELAYEVAASAWGGRGYLRLSAQVYNRPQEYDRLAEALPGLLARARAKRRARSA
jgi:isopenicillin-N epimerase